MKKSFQKTLIAASVGAVMFAAVGTASANTLLFPYFTTASGAQSVLSLVNTDVGTTGAFTAPIHYVYNYGTACTHYDAVGAMSTNDTLTHSIAAPTAGGFGLAIGSDKSVPVYFPLANQTGFLVVSKASLVASDLGLRGSMAIVDPATGLVVSYPGIDGNPATLVTTAASTEGDFSTIADLKFALTSLPSAFVTTSWYGVVTGNMGPAIAAGANWDARVNFTNGGVVYNNDEVAYSGTMTKTLNCGGTITPADLVTTAQASAVGPNGGLIKVTGTAVTGSGFTGTVANPTTTLLPVVNTSNGVVLMKMQAIQPATGGAFVGKQFLHREAANFYTAP